VLKNSVHPSTRLRANGRFFEFRNKFPFMLSPVEAWNSFFSSLLENNKTGRPRLSRRLEIYSPSPNASQIAARMKARRTLRSLGEGGWKGFGEFRKDTSALCSEELHCRVLGLNWKVKSQKHGTHHETKIC